VLRNRAPLFFAATVAAAGALSLLYYLGIRFVPYGINLYDLLRCLFAFAQGVLAWEVHRRFPGKLALPRALASVLEIVIIAAGFIAITVAPITLGQLAIPFLFAALVLVLARERGWVSDLLRRRFPVLIGELSYSIYMTHAAVFFMVAMLASNLGLFDPTQGFVPGTRGTVPDGPIADIVAFGLLTLVIAVSWCTFRWIERPAREWSRRVVDSRATRRAEAIAPTF